MTDTDLQTLDSAPPDRPKSGPGRSQLARILAERPEARPRLARAVGSLLAVTLAAVAAIGVLLVWHLRRRAGLIRERLGTAGCKLTPDELKLDLASALDLDLELPNPGRETEGPDAPSAGPR